MGLIVICDTCSLFYGLLSVLNVKFRSQHMDLTECGPSMWFVCCVKHLVIRNLMNDQSIIGYIFKETCGGKVKLVQFDSSRINNPIKRHD